MKKYVLVVVFTLWGMTGCALIDDLQGLMPKTNTPADVEDLNDWCWIAASNNRRGMENNCDLAFWMAYWVKHDNLSWPKRRALIDELGEDPNATLKKIFLSQSTGTPYQARLRAQSWADELLPRLSIPMQELLMVLVYKPSQEMLEFESALTILTRINTNQSKQLDAQQEQLLEQQQQIEQLLKIEASMMEKKEGLNNE